MRAMIVDDLTRWMKEIALPFWAEHGQDRASGAFHERLMPDGALDRHAIQRVRVQFRQIYVYAHAEVLGWHQGGAAIALTGFDHVMRAWHAPDGEPGFIHLMRPDGAIESALRDSYDHAFAVLALSWLLRATGEPRVAAALDATLAFVDAHLTAADGSLLESLPPAQPRRQNPQMHWFEAMLALKEAAAHESADRRLAQARRQFDRMIDPATGMLGEYFDDSWRPAPGAPGGSVEPGHLAEWAWLLRQHERILGLVRSDQPTRLIAHAARWFEPKTGLLVDETDRNGAIRRGTRRSWLATEWAKAQIGEVEAGIADARPRAIAALEAMDRHHLRKPFPAGWIDQLDEQARPVAGPVPSSILYHVFVAVIEADRVLGRA
jgi:mannose/cellobiose epimerase-like protein (N-acyl-D-glucosamine 2-epimerase family)